MSESLKDDSEFNDVMREEMTREVNEKAQALQDFLMASYTRPMTAILAMLNQTEHLRRNAHVVGYGEFVDAFITTATEVFANRQYQNKDEGTA